ncbi:MAG: hypothetical protein BGO98_14880 [Myxococcales bacterium 68-20]|nr:MAG: hypothetical protein BGO98_14880 [Myxococcales bacterium 68-20]
MTRFHRRWATDGDESDWSEGRRWSRRIAAHDVSRPGEHVTALALARIVGGGTCVVELGPGAGADGLASIARAR